MRQMRVCACLLPCLLVVLIAGCQTPPGKYASATIYWKPGDDRQAKEEAIQKALSAPVVRKWWLPPGTGDLTDENAKTLLSLGVESMLIGRGGFHRYERDPRGFYKVTHRLPKTTEYFHANGERASLKDGVVVVNGTDATYEIHMRRGQPVPERRVDPADTVERWAKQAAQGDAVAQFMLGARYQTAEKYPEAAVWFRKAADQGQRDAQFMLGSCYQGGLGVVKDMAEAVKWFLKAAEQGQVMAELTLGFCYAQGDGVAKDMAEAAKWWRRAADQGKSVAQYNLGLCYDTGDGVAKDMAEAVKWYLKAADQGIAPAQSNLGACYARGDGVAKDGAEAVKWSRKAADQGDAPAQFNLGIYYTTGFGVATDMAEAAKWYRKAADQGFEPAKAELRKLGK